MGDTKVGVPSEFHELANISRSLIGEAAPARHLQLKQLQQALKTGGVGARIPIIQRAVEDVNKATAQTSRGTQQQFARAGLGGSPMALQTNAAIKQAGSTEAARIPTDVAQGIISGGPGLTQGFTQMGMGGIAQTGQASMQAHMFNAQQQARMLDAIRSALAGWYGGGG